MVPAETRAGISYLSVQCDGTGLTLGADSLWPGRVALAARLDLTADVLQRCELPSEREQSRNYGEYREILRWRTRRVGTCRLLRSACGDTRGMTCASRGGRGDSGSLHQKAAEIEKKKSPVVTFKTLKKM